MGARGLGGDVEAEPVVAASVARGAGGVVCEEALAAALEGGGRKTRSVVGDLDDEAPARDVAGDSHARARVLGGVDHKVRGGSRQGGSVEWGLGRARDSRARGRVERHASRPGDLGGLGENLLAELGRPHGGPLHPAGSARGLDEQTHVAVEPFDTAGYVARGGREVAVILVFQLLRHEVGVGAQHGERRLEVVGE